MFGMILRKGQNSQEGGNVRMDILCESTDLTLFPQSTESPLS